MDGKRTNKSRNLPNPTLERLAHLYVILGKLISLGTLRSQVSSRTLSELMGVPDHTIRKDISLLKGERYFWGMKDLKTSQGYLIEQLRALIGKTLGLIRPRTVCIVGLGNMGTAILNRKIWNEGVFQLAGAFDSSENRLELLSSKVPLYHARDLETVVRKKQIEIGIVTVPPEAAQETVDRLVRGGIRGIVNLAPVILSVKLKNVILRNLSLAGELHVLSAYLHEQEEETNNG